MHKDHYENVYCVVSGHKDFILLPPTDVPWVPYISLPPATYKEVKPGEFVIEKQPGEDVPWIIIDPLKPDLESYPQYKHASPIRYCAVPHKFTHVFMVVGLVNISKKTYRWISVKLHKMIRHYKTKMW